MQFCMTAEPVNLEELVATKERLFEALPRASTPALKVFQHTKVQGEPGWGQMPFAHLQDLAAICWKQLNLGKLKKSNPKRNALQHDMLAERLVWSQ